MKMHKNCCHKSGSFSLRYALNCLSAGVLPQTPLGSLQFSPRPPSWFRGGPHREREGKRGERRGRERRESRNVKANTSDALW